MNLAVWPILVLSVLATLSSVQSMSVVERVMSANRERARTIASLQGDLRTAVASAAQRLSSATRNGDVDSDRPKVDTSVPRTLPSIRLGVMLNSEMCRREAERRRGVTTVVQIVELCFSSLRRRLQHRRPQQVNPTSQEAEIENGSLLNDS